MFVPRQQHIYLSFINKIVSQNVTSLILIHIPYKHYISLMTKTRSQMALENKNAKPGRQPVAAPAVHKISKAVKVETPVKEVVPIKKTTNAKVNGGKTSKAKASKEDPKKKELVYSDMVKQELIKKFDINEVLDQTGNSNGDCHLPRGKCFFE